MHTPSALALEDLVIPKGADSSGTWPVAWDFAEPTTPPSAPASWPTGYTVRMEIRDTYGGTLLARLDNTDGTLDLSTVTIDGGTYGRVTVDLPSATSTAWTWRTGVYDVEVVYPGGDVLRLVEGSVVLSEEATTGA